MTYLADRPVTVRVKCFEETKQTVGKDADTVQGVPCERLM